MPSQVPGYAYDIFISYRQNDNRSGWVTEFVRHLQEELAATIKEPVSVYFDSNPQDGLLETHNVDKSLEGKLRSLILIPVLSQTYCDARSFAWLQEFCAFNRIASSETQGRDIRLQSGNVASRILPVKIHDLDAEDVNAIESETGSVLRAVEFIFREPGVNRPLKPSDHRNENLNKTDYHNQVNKVANAIKEIIQAIRNPEQKKTANRLGEIFGSQGGAEKVMERPDEKSMAVIPFSNLSQDPGQEYFADGVMENILTELSGIPSCRVISRTTVMQYKRTTKTAPEISKELNVKFLVEGSVQTHKNKVRISVQLVDGPVDRQVWSKVFPGDLDDLFDLQHDVAAAVAKELNASLTAIAGKTEGKPTENLEAYDLFLKGRHAFNQWNVEGYRTASEYFLKAIEKDPEFRDAYSYLASSYSARMSWNGDLSPEEGLKYINRYLPEAWKRGATDNDYVTKAFVEFFVNKNLTAAEGLLNTAIQMNPNNASARYTYSYVLDMMGKFEAAAAMVRQAQQIEPLTVASFNYQAISLYYLERYQDAITILKEGLRLFPSVLRMYDLLARTYLTIGDYSAAYDTLKSGLRTASHRPPSMVAYLVRALAGLGQLEEARKMAEELQNRSGQEEKGVNVYLVHASLALGDMASAKRWLSRARETNDIDLFWFNVDPLFRTLREELSQAQTTAPDYGAAETFLLNKLHAEMPHLPYHNMDHVRDVVESAEKIAKAEGLTGEDVQLVRLGALLHDAGFIESASNHEERGAKMAAEWLPAFGLTQTQIGKIQAMILSTKLPQSPSSLLDKVLCDADLDYLGRDNYSDIARGLFEEMKMNGALETEREWNLVQQTFLSSHRYHTGYCIREREPVKQQHLKEIIDGLRGKA
ncbi:MAG: HD domain-containing protein [Bacteroidetes bacterium]|nr:HD domain-containing protein [Bacteroidota bacterium]